MPISKETKSLGMDWEEDYGYDQGVRVGDTIYLAGQVSHDEAGEIVGVGDTAAQLRQSYANVERVLVQYGATMANVVDEVTFVMDIDAAQAAAHEARWAAFGGRPRSTSTLIQVARLALPDLLVEVKCVAKV